jgi:hypothetical protein
MSAAFGEDLSWFFDQYVYGNSEPEVTVELIGNELRLTQTGAAKNVIEVWLESDRGPVEVERVTIEGPQTVHSFIPEGTIVRARPSPRQQPLIRFRSGNDLDVDFDSQIDGADLVRCAHQVGNSAVLQTIGEGVFTGNTEFETRCDLVRDGRVGPDDLDQLLARFPEVRP